MSKNKLSIIPHSSKIVVAAADSSEMDRRMANFVCDGIDDAVEIRQAFEEANLVGVTIVEMTGTFHLGGITFLGINRFKG